MYLEIAQIEITPGRESDFEEAVAGAVSIFKKSRGCASMELRRSFENPSKYLLFVKWETMEDHVDHFKNSPDGLQAWRKVVSHFYAATPTLEHSTLAVTGFKKD